MSGTLNGMNTASESSQQESEMDTSTTHQFSAISTHSSVKGTPQAIKDWLMLSVADSHASHTVQPESSLEKTTQRTDGLQQEKSFAKYDQSSASWKTCLGLFPSDISEKFSGTWPKWGSMRNGELFQQPQPVQTMYERGSGYLPTPTAHNAKEGAYPAEYARNTPTLAAVLGGKISPHRQEWMMGFPIGWTGLQPVVMDKFQSWQQAHGRF